MIEVNHLPFPSSKISFLLEANSENHPKLIKNEIVEGKVIKSLSLNTAMLLIKGKKVLAKTHIPLREGSILSLKVEETSPIPSLKPISTKSTGASPVNLSIILAAIKENFWESIIKDINRAGLSEKDGSLIKKLMDDLSSRLFLKSTPESLKILIDKSGLCWEAKLRNALIHKSISPENMKEMIEGDLKGLASKYLAFQEEEGGSLKKFVSALQNIQILNHLGLEQDRKIYIPVPVQFPDGFFTIGQLLIRLPQEEDGEAADRKKDKDIFRITFLLELSRLGPIRADLAVRGKEIEGKFLMAKEETRSLIENNLPQFTGELENKGFYIRRLTCYLLDPETVKQPLVTEIIGKEGSTMDLVV